MLEPRPSAIARDDDRLVTYRGNGTYTLVLPTLYSAGNCGGTATPVRYQWTTPSSTVALSAPGGPQLIRDAEHQP